MNNLKQLGLVLNMYSNENNDKYPLMDDVYNRFMFDSDILYPEYLSDVAIMACPSDPETNPNTNFRLTASYGGVGVGQVHPVCIGALSYVYVGSLIMTDNEMLGALASYTWLDSVLPITDPTMNGWRDVSINLASFGFAGWGNSGGSMINNLSAGVDRFLITDINTIFTGNEVGSSVVPVMWDQISTAISEFSHVPAGQNVPYLDGHVDFHRYDINSTAFSVSPMCAAVNGGTEGKILTLCP